ncbi:MAG TPA: ADOP family duplicated permease [Bryobacteraceae bacterium]|nr:ADOP family duplicated permease [Bryobacteraceae bacterium]
MLDSGARHLRLAIRTFLRNKSAYLSVIGTLTLGIAMSIAMFSLVDAVLLRPLPFPRQESIQVIWKTDPLAGTHVEELAYPELRDLQESIPDFESVAVMPTSLYGYARVLQTGTAEPVQIESAPVSHDFFRVLGVSPILGRDFTKEDERVGAPPVVVLSDRVWRNQMGADGNIVGRMIRLNGQGHTVIGVMAPGVEFPRGAGLWIPLGVERRIVERRGATFLQAIARLNPGVSRERVAIQVNALFTRLAVDYPDTYTRSQQGVVMPLVEYWTGSTRIQLWIVLGASLLLLSASVMSASNLLLSRTISRRSEIATRLALGARRGQILTQLGTEGALIAMAAVTAGMTVAQYAIRVLIRWAPEDIPRLSDAALNLDCAFFAAGVAALAAIACTVIPGWSATRMQVEAALREGGARSSMSRRASRARSLFVAAQSAVTVVLLVVASLLILSYRSMMSAHTGFANRDAVSMNLQLRGPGMFSGQAFDANFRRSFYTELLKRLRDAPGVTSAAAVLLRPLEGTIGWDVPYEFEFEAGREQSRVLPKVNFEVVTPDYFKTIGTVLLEGRDFDEHDAPGGEPVAIVSRTLARKIQGAGHAPVGHRIRIGSPDAPWTKIVGVSADARYRSVTQSGADIFVPYSQAPQPTNYVVLRGSLPSANLAALVRETLAKIDSNQTIAGVATVGELIGANTARNRFNAILLLWFGVCAGILSAAGVYSVVAEAMAARDREIAIRTALGAQRFRLVREIVAGTLAFVVMGELFGTFAVSAFGNLGSGVLYGVTAHNPLILGSVALFLFLVSLGSAGVPAWSASGRDPKIRLTE